MAKTMRHPGSAVTVREFCARYLAEVVARDRKDPAAVARYLERDVMPRLGRLRMDRVSGRHVQSIVFGRRDAGKPASALALRGVVKRLWDYGLVCGVAKENPATSVPRRYVGRLRSRERVLMEDELGRLLRVLAADGGRGAMAVELLLLTMVRKGELRLARWSEFDLERGEWAMAGERTKMGRAHVVYLPPRAVELLRALRSRQIPEVEMVLPMGSAWWTPASASWLNARLRLFERRADVPHFTVHDLRRTAATHLTEMGWAPEVVEKALGHALRSVRGVYNRAEFAEKRRAMLEAWAVQLDRLRRNG